MAVDRDLRGLDAVAQAQLLRRAVAMLLDGKTLQEAADTGMPEACFQHDGRICLSNNAAERSIRSIAVGRRNWTFCGSDAGGHRAAVKYTLIESAKQSDVDPKAWLADVLARIADHPAQRLEDLLPRN